MNTFCVTLSIDASKIKRSKQKIQAEYKNFIHEWSNFKNSTYFANAYSKNQIIFYIQVASVHLSELTSALRPHIKKSDQLKIIKMPQDNLFNMDFQ